MTHISVPKHEVLKKSDAEKVLNQYNITTAQLPKIRASDPALKQINSKIGDVIKITRKSPTAGISVYYRVVVEK